jgi:hypothetical protein
LIEERTEQLNEDYSNTLGFADAHRGRAVGKKGFILKVQGFLAGVTPSLKK